MRHYKTIPWKEFFRVEDPAMVTLRLVPDRTTDNRQNFKLIRALHEFYTAPLGRLSFGRWFIGYRPKERFWYDVVLAPDEIKFYFTVPKRWEVYTRQKLGNAWPRAAIEAVDPKELYIPLEDTRAAELVYKRHDIFALHCDRTEDTMPLGAIMAATADMQEGDLARLSICADPVHRLNWQDQAEQAHKLFSKGKTPQRRGISKRKALVSTGAALEGIFAQLGDLMLAVLGHAEDDKPEPDMEKRQILIDGRLETATMAKKTEPTYKTFIRVVSHSTDAQRREMTARALANSFVEVTGDNELERVDLKPRATVRIIYELNTHRLKPGSLMDLDSTIMGASELGKLMQLPSAGLQDKFADLLDTIKTRQEAVPAAVAVDGLPMGTVEIKKAKAPVFMPVKNKDEFCLPSVSIMGMGMGKSTLAANMAVGAQRLGFGAVTIDPAKRGIGKDIMRALDPKDYMHIDLSKDLMALDFREAYHAARMSTRMANTILNFFAMEEADMLQTERFLFAAVMAMQTRRLGEILKILQDTEYRAKVIKAMPEGVNRATLLEFDKYQDGRRAQILAPILNRMAIIFRDDYLAECMDADTGLDFVDLLQQEKVIIIDVPDDSFDPLAKDLLINLLTIKIDIAMRLRPEENQFPFLVILDEPHQYLRSARFWERATVEARKFGIKYCWFFHYFDQLPKALISAIMNAGPHYHIGRTSEDVYRILGRYLAPYTLDDVIKMPSFHCINVLRANRETVAPFMAHMPPPPAPLAQAAAK